MIHKHKLKLLTNSFKLLNKINQKSEVNCVHSSQADQQLQTNFHWACNFDGNFTQVDFAQQLRFQLNTATERRKNHEELVRLLQAVRAQLQFWRQNPKAPEPAENMRRHTAGETPGCGRCFPEPEHERSRDEDGVRGC